VLASYPSPSRSRYIGPVLLAAGNLYRTFRWPLGAKVDVLANGMVATAAALLMVVGVVVGAAAISPLHLVSAKEEPSRNFIAARRLFSAIFSE